MARIGISAPNQVTVVSRPPVAATGVVSVPVSTTTVGRFEHIQRTPAATWTITHNLGKRVPVALYLSADPTEPVYTDVRYPDNNTVVVEWPSPETGRAVM